jgi:hypothetical protein
MVSPGSVPMFMVSNTRTEAKRKVLDEYEIRRANILAKPTRDRTAKELKFTVAAGKTAFLKRFEASERDRVLENSILFMCQALINVDFFRSLRRGAVGRAEKDLDVMTVCFQGSRRSNYARMLLERKFDQKYLWTEEHLYLDLINNVMNRGKDQQAHTMTDETLEHINDDINTAGGKTVQSEDFVRDVIAPNIVPFRMIRDSVLSSAGVTEYGSRHSRPDPSDDIAKVIEILVREEALVQRKGRYMVGPTGSKVEVYEAVDMFDEGSKKIMFGGVLEKMVKRRAEEDENRRAVPEIPNMDQDEWTAWLQNHVNEWNDVPARMEDYPTEDMEVE